MTGASTLSGLVVAEMTAPPGTAQDVSGVALRVNNGMAWGRRRRTLTVGLVSLERTGEDAMGASCSIVPDQHESLGGGASHSPVSRGGVESPAGRNVAKRSEMGRGFECDPTCLYTCERVRGVVTVRGEEGGLGCLVLRVGKLSMWSGVIGASPPSSF